MMRTESVELGVAYCISRVTILNTEEAGGLWDTCLKEQAHGDTSDSIKVSDSKAGQRG